MCTTTPSRLLRSLCAGTTDLRGLVARPGPLGSWLCSSHCRPSRYYSAILGSSPSSGCLQGSSRAWHPGEFFSRFVFNPFLISKLHIITLQKSVSAMEHKNRYNYRLPLSRFLLLRFLLFSFSSLVCRPWRCSSAIKESSPSSDCLPGSFRAWHPGKQFFRLSSLSFSTHASLLLYQSHHHPLAVYQAAPEHDIQVRLSVASFFYSSPPIYTFFFFFALPAIKLLFCYTISGYLLGSSRAWHPGRPLTLYFSSIQMGIFFSTSSFSSFSPPFSLSLLRDVDSHAALFTIFWMTTRQLQSMSSRMGIFLVLLILFFFSALFLSFSSSFCRHSRTSSAIPRSSPAGCLPEHDIQVGIFIFHVFLLFMIEFA